MAKNKERKDFGNLLKEIDKGKKIRQDAADEFYKDLVNSSLENFGDTKTKLYELKKRERETEVKLKDAAVAYVLTVVGELDTGEGAAYRDIEKAVKYGMERFTGKRISMNKKELNDALKFCQRKSLTYEPRENVYRVS